MTETVTPRQSDDHIVYGVFADEAFFLPREEAERTSSLLGALMSSTWGELRQAMPDDPAESTSDDQAADQGKSKADEVEAIRD